MIWKTKQLVKDKVIFLHLDLHLQFYCTDVGRVSQLTTTYVTHPPSLHQCLAITICQPSIQRCFFCEYNVCSGPSQMRPLKTFLNVCQNVTLIQCSSTDWTTHVTIAKPVKALHFSRSITSPIIRLPYALTAKQAFLQTEMYYWTTGTCRVMWLCHSFVCEIKFMYHSHNAEPSIHLFAIYLKVCISDAVTHENFAVISECLKLINLFQ